MSSGTLRASGWGRRAGWLLLVVLALAGGGVGGADAGGNKKVEWLREHAVVVRSNDPADQDFSDLEPLVDAIGPARIVMLGESDHGSGGDFLAKARLIKFLHQRLGFDVLAWESGLFDCQVMEEALHRDMPLELAIQEGIFAVWSMSREVRPVFEYARSTHGTDRPLEMAGFDLQFSSSNILGTFPQSFAQFFDAGGPAILSDAQRRGLLEHVEVFGRLIDFQRASEDRRQRAFQFLGEMSDLLDRNRAALVGAHGQRRVDFHRRVLEKARVLEEFYRAYINRVSPWDPVNVRDREMGANMLWLARVHFADRKIIVWAHNGHIMRDADDIFVPATNDPIYEDVQWMGEWVSEELGDQVYTLAFTAYQGETRYATGGTARSFRAPKGSLEAAMHQTGAPFLFLDVAGLRDLSRLWLRKPRIANPIGYTPMRSDWTHVWDGYFFSDEMVGASQ